MTPQPPEAVRELVERLRSRMGDLGPDELCQRAADMLTALSLTKAGEELSLLRELHAAMADAMMLRRPSSGPAQREIADSAIAVWRRVQAYLAALTPTTAEQDPSNANR